MRPRLTKLGDEAVILGAALVGVVGAEVIADPTKLDEGEIPTLTLLSSVSGRG